MRVDANHAITVAQPGHLPLERDRAVSVHVPVVVRAAPLQGPLSAEYDHLLLRFFTMLLPWEETTTGCCNM